ncbi:MAG: spore coat protein CotJB [Clostridiales bacterium]|nr:spore coat protein CotJB [Clostridiales bacterium]
MNQESARQICCSGGQGTLPPCAPLAVPYVPFQQASSAKYDAQEALAQGTLFPSLNLPFHLMVNGAEVPKTPLSELQALCFVVTELGLYLDTHKDDQEAFQMFQKYAAMAKSTQASYEEQYGPLQQISAAADAQYTWLCNPWPWNEQQEAE